MGIPTALQPDAVLTVFWFLNPAKGRKLTEAMEARAYVTLLLKIY